MLDGKAAIVTGSAQGIGRGIALELASEGASVLMSDVSPSVHDVASEIRSKGYNVISTLSDVSSRKQVDAMTEAAIKEFGRLDVLVNNAGIYPFKPLDRMTEKDWSTVIDVNLKSVFNCTSSALPHLKINGGSIVNLSSIAGSVVGYEALTHYSASKAGILGFTRAAALELAKYRIRVNAIAPGPIETPTTMRTLTDDVRRGVIESIPLRRLGVPRDIGRLVVFLASEDSGYITGQLIVVDGGLTIS